MKSAATILVTAMFVGIVRRLHLRWLARRLWLCLWPVAMTAALNTTSMFCVRAACNRTAEGQSRRRFGADDHQEEETKTRQSHIRQVRRRQLDSN